MATTDGKRRRRPYAARMPIEQRRLQLLDAALAIIVRDGYAAVTIDAIVAEAGVTKPVFYGAYPKLAELLTALLERTQTDAVGQLLAAFPSDPDALRDPHLAGQIARAWAQAVRKNPLTWTPVLLTGAQTPAVVLEWIEQGRVTVRSGLAALLPGKKEAEKRRNRWLAESLVAVAEHYGRMILAEPDAISDDELAQHIDDLTLGYLGRT